MKRFGADLIAIAIIIASVLAYARQIGKHEATAPTVVHAAPSTPEPDPKQFTAALDVARVFGRSPGCAEADSKLITDVATEALRTGIDPRVLAATVAVESSCNQYATSNKGAIGLMQVTPRTWKGTYDFDRKFNLLNAEDNIHVGAAILAGYLKQYGVPSGLHHYNGMGVSCDVCDAGYADKIIALAGRK